MGTTNTRGVNGHFKYLTLTLMTMSWLLPVRINESTTMVPSYKGIDSSPFLNGYDGLDLLGLASSPFLVRFYGLDLLGSILVHFWSVF